MKSIFVSTLCFQWKIDTKLFKLTIDHSVGHYGYDSYAIYLVLLKKRKLFKLKTINVQTPHSNQDSIENSSFLIITI